MHYYFHHHDVFILYTKHIFFNSDVDVVKLIHLKGSPCFLFAVLFILLYVESSVFFFRVYILTIKWLRANGFTLD